MNNSVSIIGGGIGGLTTALALKKADIPFVLYEASEEIKAVGAGIIMANNAMQVFRMLGIHQEVEARGYKINRMDITRGDLSVLSSIHLNGFESRYGLQNHAIHRADLYDIIAGAVGYEHIRINKRLRSIRSTGDGYLLTFEDDSTVLSGYVIGADGIRSRVRQELFSENEYRDAGQVCWRGTVKFTLPENFRNVAVEAWEKGKRFGFVQTSDTMLYWYLVVNSDMEKAGTSLLGYAEGFHPFVHEMLGATPGGNIIKGPLYDLRPIHTWSGDKVCLVGDAAHATTPNLGQGACQAIEDAYVLGELLKKHPIGKAFQLYPEIRRGKAHHVVNTSWKLGVISHYTNPLAIGLRNFILRFLTPGKVNLEQMDKLFRLDQV